MKYLFGVNPGDVMFSASDIGWIVGHKFIVYGPLLRGATSIVYEGKPVSTPDAGVLPRLVEKHKIDHLYLAPTAVRAIKKDDHEGLFIKKHD
jgi:propionyl-CoA synthetase